ncbi:MAG: RdgB/HAM1 family non-canonical purine NTP pyrophosphatase [Gammaproteobacteria bacterium]|jgi:XTP/dITP diphosphohydrolase|nr:RdgB/HAM1 family non-canonical purine NTP pyrophosphatase [Gammaproteobacteria bacterium]
MELVLASGNAGKLREIAAMLDGLSLTVRAQSDFNVGSVAETGTTFVENAIIKARHAARMSGRPALADDSGIAVDALGGAPGVFSARYAGEGASDEANLRKLLDVTAHLPDAERGCRFVCVMVAMRDADDPLPVIATGLWPGRLLHAPRGTGGFGYDPIFLVPEAGCSSAELEPALKNRLSHRGQALRSLRALLKQADAWR